MFTLNLAEYKMNTFNLINLFNSLTTGNVCYPGLKNSYSKIIEIIFVRNN
jgi:hypothetical protein